MNLIESLFAWSFVNLCAKSNLLISVRSQIFPLTDNQMLPKVEYSSQKWQQDILMQLFLVYLTFMQNNLR